MGGATLFLLEYVSILEYGFILWYAHLMNDMKQKRVERRKEERRQNLVDAARELFLSRGYDGTTIDDIVTRADLAKVTFYAYFKSKEEMALEVKRQASEEALEYLDDLLNRKLPAQEMLNQLIEDIVTWTEANWRLLDVFCSQRFSPLVNREENQECKPEPMMLCIDAIISRGQQQGIYRQDIDRSRVAHILDLAILCEQYRWVKAGRPQGELKESLESCMDFAVHGIKNPESL